MGMVVFGTYDGVVHSWKNYRDRCKDETLLRNADGKESRTMDRASIWVHGLAGAASGVTRSLFWVGWERFVYDIPHSLAFSWRILVHHAVGHGVLFGGYHGLRSILLENRSHKKVIGSINEKDDYYPILASVLAGGWAGQMHHVVQHYISHWREFRQQQRSRLRPPRLRPTMAAFVPMALSFAAFEHGAEGVEELLEYIQSIL